MPKMKGVNAETVVCILGLTIGGWLTFSGDKVTKAKGPNKKKEENSKGCHFNGPPIGQMTPKYK